MPDRTLNSPRLDRVRGEKDADSNKLTSPSTNAARFGSIFWRRTRSDAGLLLAVLLGILIATTVLSGAWTYLRSLERVSVAGTVEKLSPALRGVSVTNRRMPFTKGAFEEGSAAVAEAMSELGGLVSGDGHFVRTPPVLWGPAEEGVRVDELAPPGLVQRMAHIDANVVYREGRAPSELVNRGAPVPVVEVSVPLERAREFDVKSGDVLEIAPSMAEYGRFLAVVSGLFDPIDARSTFWASFGPNILSPGPIVQDGPLPLPIFMRGDAIWEITAESPIAVGTGQWFGYLDADVLNESLTKDVIERTNAYRLEVQKSIPRALVFSGPSAAFSALDRRALFSRIPTYLMGALLISVAAYYLAMVAGLLAERRSGDISMLRSRGISTIQVARMYAVEAAPLIGLPVVVAPFLSMFLISQIGKLSNYRAVTGGGALPLDLSWVPFAYSLGAGIVALAILVTPAVVHARGNVVAERRSAGRPTAAPLFQRYFLDALVLALGGLVFWELRNQQTIVVSDLAGERSADLSSLFGPALLLAAAALVFLRIFPLILGTMSWLIGRRAPVWASLAIWKLARSPYRYAWPILLLVLASGLGVVSASLASTLERSSNDRIAYETAGDFRLQRVTAKGGSDGETLTKLREIPGVTAASIGLRSSGTLGTTDRGHQFQIFAVQPDEFATISWFREDFAATDLETLLASVAVPGRPPPVPLPDGTLELGMWARADPPALNLFLWLVLRDSSGRFHTVTLGPVEGPDWHYQSAEVPERIVQPATLSSVLIFEPTSGDAGSATTISLDDLEAVYAGEGGQLTRRLVTPFESRDGWAALPTSEGLDTGFSLAPEDAPIGMHEGGAVAELELGRGTDSGVRGIYRAVVGDALPVIASETFLEANGLTVGDSFVARAFSNFTPFTVAGSTVYFPPLNPERGGFVVADYAAVADYVQFRGAFLPTGRDEIFFATDGSGIDELGAEVRSVVNKLVAIVDRESLAEASLVDSVAVAGWRGMAVVAIVCTVIIAALGYGTYLVAYVGRERLDTAFLRALGMSKSSYLGMVAVEHLSIALFGLVIGSLTGLAMSQITVDSFAHTETGGRLLPPFVMVTQWLPASLVYAALAIVGIAAGARMVRVFSRTALYQATRLEE